MYYFLLFVILLLILLLVINIIDIFLRKYRYSKLVRLENRLNFKIKQQERFLNTLASKIAAFELTAKIKKVIEKGENK